MEDMAGMEGRCSRPPARETLRLCFAEDTRGKPRRSDLHDRAGWG
jgi:hypothetical protein